MGDAQRTALDDHRAALDAQRDAQDALRDALEALTPLVAAAMGSQDPNPSFAVVVRHPKPPHGPPTVASAAAGTIDSAVCWLVDPHKTDIGSKALFDEDLPPWDEFGNGLVLHPHPARVLGHRLTLTMDTPEHRSSCQGLIWRIP